MSSTRKRIIVVGTVSICIVVVTVLGVLWLGMRQWNELAATAQQQLSSVKHAHEQVRQSSSREDRVSQLRNVIAGDTTCDGTWWFAWQAEMLKQARERRQVCRDARTQQHHIASAASALHRYIADEEKVLSVLRRLTIDDKAKNWQATAQRSATEAVKTLEDVVVSSAVEPVKVEAVQRTKAIAAGWKALASANKEKDRTAYEKAVKMLQSAYEKIDGVAAVSEKAIRPLIVDFLQS